ncbi:MAG: hypothetical protein D3909_16180 [Candidatus Electrothrix sp. ATG1]|nr:hypothetical protein [Candidatus Electrothrix sp. ATG1]
MDAHTVIDARIGKQLGDWATLSFEADNILDSDKGRRQLPYRQKLPAENGFFLLSSFLPFGEGQQNMKAGWVTPRRYRYFHITPFR